MASLGINCGSSSVKLVVVEEGRLVRSLVAPHEGELEETIRRSLEEIDAERGMPSLVTGNEGRNLFTLPSLIEPLAEEAALRGLGITAEALVSLGGEDLVVYGLGADGTIAKSLSGSKCASGTGEFLKQQLARMDMGLEELERLPEDARVLPLSTRCSVFMKSDCTHRLNKREASKADIALSLSAVMAGKVADFLKRARIESGKVVLAGGVTKNRHILRLLRELLPAIEFVVPPEAPFLEAYGAALLAETEGAPLPSFESLFGPGAVLFPRLPDLKTASSRVSYFPSREAPARADRDYVLGVDGGSTTTKACLVDAETREIVASHYGRTHGDPVAALKVSLSTILEHFKTATGGREPRIVLTAATGSSREILGVFLETPGVYNEIIAHATGTAFFAPEADTIFEIGGQDAKYVLLENGVPVDYAMNEACSAGTGSFLEESAAGDLAIGSAAEIGPIALEASAPLKFGEHCSAFINSDIRKAIQQGASRADITAGIVSSIVANYLNRVVGNRRIGKRVFLQGGVAKNPAVPLAFASLLDKDILVPPSPELMGCFGVALLALKKREEGLLEEASWSLPSLIAREIGYEKVFTCVSCENRCPIQLLSVGGRSYPFGGRCNKYANLRRKARELEAVDYVERRETLLFRDCAPPAEGFAPRRSYKVGIPRAFSVHSLYPLYAWFFRELGIETFLSTEVSRAGVARTESSYCFPAEIAHGAVQDCLDKGADYVLLPHFRDMPSFEKEVHANFCPITQGFPYYIARAFPEIPSARFLPLVVSFKYGEEKALEHFLALGERLGIEAEEVRRAFALALEKQKEYFRRARELGEEALALARSSGRPAIALLGRPYNAFTSEADMGIPRKFLTRGYTVIPFDLLPFEDESIFPNMYWYYGQEDLKSAVLAAREAGLYVAYITNFSCAPDSFILHYLGWIMGRKPYLILELDSHSADAGIDTRVEAFLDIIEGYRAAAGLREEERYDNGWRFHQDGLYLEHEPSGERQEVRNNPRVKILLSNMGNIATEFMAATLRGIGIGAEALPIADARTLQVARAHASGKECVPSHLVLGSALRYFASERYKKDELYLLFVPITTGPCRTGQYYVYFQNLFRDLRIPNVVVFTLSADNSYTELGPRFSRDMWLGLAVTDYLKDMQTALMALAADPPAAQARFEELWRGLMLTVEREPDRLIPELRRLGRESARIPRKRELGDLPRVLVVGEIYVRRDDFAVSELLKRMAERGIVPKVSGICEWIHYLDFVRGYNLRKLRGLEPAWKRLFSRPSRDLLTLGIEEWWKHRVERRVKAALAPSGLLPEAPHDMKRIMANTAEHFVSHELNSEIAVSSGVAATAMEEGYSGIVNISPFACLIGRVIEGLYAPWARERGYPAISVEVDGNILPPALVSKLEIFMVNVLRYRRGPGPGERSFVDPSKGLEDSPAGTGGGPGSGGLPSESAAR